MPCEDMARRRPSASQGARCKKLMIECIHGVRKKGEALSTYLKENEIDPQTVIYIGNDINDLPCFPLVGCAFAPADADVRVKNEADQKGLVPNQAISNICALSLA